MVVRTSTTENVSDADADADADAEVEVVSGAAEAGVRNKSDNSSEMR
ncbi:hypothetical protein [Embleya sp. NPDC005971]